MTDGLTNSLPRNWGERFKLRLSAIIWFVLAAGSLLALPVLIDVSWLVVLGLGVLALILALPGAWLVRKLFSGQRGQSFFSSFAKAFFALLFTLSIILAAPIYYFALYTDLKPMTVPQATLSNGSKTVVSRAWRMSVPKAFTRASSTIWRRRCPRATCSTTKASRVRRMARRGSASTWLAGAI